MTSVVLGTTVLPPPCIVREHCYRARSQLICGFQSTNILFIHARIRPTDCNVPAISNGRAYTSIIIKLAIRLGPRCVFRIGRDTQKSTGDFLRGTTVGNPGPGDLWRSKKNTSERVKSRRSHLYPVPQGALPLSPLRGEACCTSHSTVYSR